jgi:hypothetical protein
VESAVDDRRQLTARELRDERDEREPGRNGDPPPPRTHRAIIALVPPCEITGAKEYDRPVDERSQERLARNEAFFREVNERIREVADRFGGDEYEFVCECSDPNCSARISLTAAKYERVRANGTRFVLAPGHEVPSIENTIADEGDHVVVEKRGEAGATAEELDPRR